MIKILKYILTLLLLLVLIWLAFYLYGQETYEVEYGISFNQYHAESLGLDWKQTYIEMLRELDPKYVRIAAMWSEIEANKGVYDFSKVDWMMNKAEEHDTKVLLVTGQKTPRWPECHIPDWLNGYDKQDSKKHLMNYITTTTKRYRNHPALDMWQVENEPYISFEFGKCEGYREDLVDDEVKLVKKLDPDHKIMITDSGEMGLWYKASKAGDILGTTIYRAVRTPSDNVFTYDWLPAGFYKFKARLWGKGYEEFFVSELQAEPWFRDANPLDAPLEKQEETMNPERLKDNLNYAKRVGASRVYLWGVEWWDYMRQKRGEKQYWNIIKKELE